MTGPASHELPVPARALAVGAHPDDIEFQAGATLARWAAAGCEISLLICTDGSKGTWDPDADEAERRGFDAAYVADIREMVARAPEVRAAIEASAEGILARNAKLTDQLRAQRLRALGALLASRLPGVRSRTATVPRPMSVSSPSSPKRASTPA